MLIRALQRNNQEDVGVCVYICGEIYLKELAYTIVGAGESKICRAGWWAGDPGKN